MRQIDNRTARRIFLERHGLTSVPGVKQTKDDLLDVIDALGFVQVDSINTVARAHDLILFARNQTYRPQHLKKLLEDDAALFESWTHDASIIPARFYPYWKRRFERERILLMKRWRNWREGDFEAAFAPVLQHVVDSGPTMARDLGDGEKKNAGGWWDWHPTKTALEFLWRTGTLAVCGREGFQKRYDLTERVIRDTDRNPDIPLQDFIDWSCHSALKRLGFATAGEIAAFWDSVTPAEAKDWCEKNKDLLEPVEIESSDGSKPRLSFMLKEGLAALLDPPEPPKRLRILSPFDPMIRDRKRTERLFNFDYRIEVFVPEAKRQYGYYVFPVLEGDSLIGRIDMKADRKAGQLNVAGLWLEAKVRPSKGRLAALTSELKRLTKFSGCETLHFSEGWIKV